MRSLISRHLVGSGVELGAGTSPFPLAFPGATVTYLDHFEPDESRELHPELGDDYTFRKPDVTCNFDADRLRMLDDASQDFVVASHLLEHLANPIGMLDEIHRVLRPGGIALVLLPDMRRTFDRARTATPLDHLVAEFEAGVSEVDDVHIHDFLEATETPDDFAHLVVDAAPADRKRLFEWHRLRSIHAHCWSETDFQPVIDYAIGELGHRWEFVDGIMSDDEGPQGFEFGYVMRRSQVELPPEVAVERFRATWQAWLDDRRAMNDAVAAVATPAAAAPAGALVTEATRPRRGGSRSWLEGLVRRHGLARLRSATRTTP
jgi:SAM-dependent methyltransferase